MPVLNRFLARVANKLQRMTLENRLARAIEFRLRIRRLRKAIRHSDRPCLVVGASGTCHPGWISTEEDEIDLLDQSTWARLVDPGEVAAITAEHVWEHLTADQAVEAARNCFHYLKPGGHLRCAVPDGLHPSETYIEWVRPGGNGPGCDDHFALYTFQTLADVFLQAGFEVNLLEYYDFEQQFHANDWDPQDGMILRSVRFDPQNYEGKFFYSSLILDAVRPTTSQPNDGAESTDESSPPALSMIDSGQSSVNERE